MRYLLSLLFVAAIASCSTNSDYTNNIKSDVVFLSDDALEGRKTGTEGEIKAAEFISKRFKELGLLPKGSSEFEQKFSFNPKTDPHSEVEYKKNEEGKITGRNVLGYINNNAESTVIIGAHYDHLGWGGQGSLFRDSIKAIHNGADDNASGVALMLDLAQKIKKSENKSNNYLFMAFSGEEMGLLGSNYFVKNPTIDTKSVSYMINMDMVGRLKQDTTLAIYGVGTTPVFKDILNTHNKDFKLVMKESGVGPSDHTSFYLADIPVLHFFTGQHDDYHRPSDDHDKINYEGMNKLSDYIFSVITDLNDNGKLEFTKTKNENESTPRFKVGLGVVPDYLYDGKGMRIDGVTEGKPAQKAGLKKGDVVIQLGDSSVTDMMSYMRALSVFSKGDKTKVIFSRGDKQIEAPLEF